MTVAEFVVWSERQPDGTRHELVDGLPVDMSLGSVRHYLVIDPEARLAYHHSRTSPSGDILTRIITDGAIELDPPGVSIELAECFIEVDLLEPES